MTTFTTHIIHYCGLHISINDVPSKHQPVPGAVNIQGKKKRKQCGNYLLPYIYIYIYIYIYKEIY